jgi:hypothetical protein
VLPTGLNNPAKDEPVLPAPFGCGLTYTSMLWEGTNVRSKINFAFFS